MAYYGDWLGRSRATGSRLDPWCAQALYSTINTPAEVPGQALPMLWHWLYFLETPLRSEQGPDGHPRKGDFYPPVENPRRMFVGARSQVQQALELGQPAQLVERIAACEEKQGSSGAMTLMTVAYEYSQQDKLCVTEERDFMYLPARTGETPESRVEQEVVVPSASVAWDVPTDPVLLFRFSALTFNGHRIHYDAEYARREEAYPGLVVHGPLTALLLAELARSELGSPLREYSFRARAPFYVGDRLRLRGETDGDGMKLAAYRPDATIAMTAEAKP